MSDDDARSITDDELPVYTLLVPLFHESEMLPHILQNIAEIDYPKEKLDVKILMEEEDTETLEKARKLGLFGNIEEIIAPMSENEYHRFLSIFHPIIIPNAEIKTKPRACNYGLKRARGEFVVIYDAEDLPDRDQLKKTVLAFRNLGEEYACVQCLLNFYNARKNLLTRWFSIEYSYYYDYYIQGLDKMEAPIPLGGTSNHFRMKTLKELGAWDPFNVTEDADIGMRIARKKYKTGVLNSHTYEEAVPDIKNWIRQRSRWVKGFVITWFVTMRHPIQVLRDIGLKNFLIFQTGFGGNFYLPLMNFFLWMVLILGFIIPDYISGWFNFWPFAVVAVFNLVVGNLFFLIMMMLATWKEKKGDLLIYSFFSPIYWILITIGAWRGLLQLIVKPYKWDKTYHGSTFLNQDLLHNEPDNFSKSIRWIDVKQPEMNNGSTKATIPQIAFSIGVSVLLVLCILILFGIITVHPISDHLTIKNIPGLSQVIEPYNEYKAGREPNLLNTEAIIKPYQTITPKATITITQVTISPTQATTPPPAAHVRTEKTIISDIEPGLTLRYDPCHDSINVTTLDARIPGVRYEIRTQDIHGNNRTYTIESLPGNIVIPYSKDPVTIEIFKTYKKGTKVPVLRATIQP